MLFTIDIPEENMDIVVRFASLLRRATPTVIEDIEMGIAYIERLAPEPDM